MNKALPIIITILALVAGGCSAPSAKTTDKPLSEIETWLREYKSWHKIIEERPSTLHWNKTIASYIREYEAIETFGHNYKLERLETQGADEFEIEEAGGFKMYAPDTLIAKSSIEIREDGSSKLVDVTFMHKMQTGQWRYVQATPEGEVLFDSFRGNYQAAFTQCIQCHNGVEHRDFLFHTYFDYKNTDL
ncbi:MAG: hypothetical protein ACPGN3_14435 [Opitutales bacterium]